MKIDLDTLEKQKEIAAKSGGAVAALLGLDGSLEEQPLFVLERGLLGSGGEVLTSDRHIEFKSDRGFSKLKGSSSIKYSDVTRLTFDGLASWHRWTFDGPREKFEIALIYYGSRNGIGPGDHMWYDIDTFPARSAAFWHAAGTVLRGSGIPTGAAFTSTVERGLDESVGMFEQSPQLAFDGLTQITRNDVYAPWTALYDAFSQVVAGACASSEEQARDWLVLFRKLDGFYARILFRFMAEIERQGGRMLERETAILSLGDQFQRLASLWYLRQIVRVHLAEKHLSQDEIRPWTLKILTPRARIYGNEKKIQIPEQSLFEEQIAALGN